MTSVVYYIAGVPASGKTTIVRTLIEKLLPAPEEIRYGKLRGIKQRNVEVLGVYDGSKFDGTDRLPMDVINDAIEYIQNTRKLSPPRVFIVEGDRLLNKRFLNAVAAKIIVIDATAEILHQRHQQRRDTQDTAFLKRCRKKVENIIQLYNLKRYWNNTPQDTERLVNYLTKEIERYE